MYFYIVYESIINQVSSTISRMSCLFLSNILRQHCLVEIKRSKLLGGKSEFRKVQFRKKKDFRCEIIALKEHAVASMLVTEVGDEMCWWQLSDVRNCFAILVTNIVTISYFFNWHFWDRKYNFWKFWTENVYGSMYWVGFGRLFQFKWSKMPILFLNERLPIYEKVYSVPKSMSLILFMTILGSISHIDLTRYAPFLTHYGK